MSHSNDHSSVLGLVGFVGRLGASEARYEVIFSMSLDALIEVFLVCVLGFDIFFLTVVGHIAVGFGSILVFWCFLNKI